ncbi:MAG: hypothetical protein RIS35_3063 [Pseudomonadota bacterium]
MRASVRLLIAAIAIQPLALRAADSVILETGRSYTRDHSIEVVRLGFAWDWRRHWALSDRWSLGGYWETSVGHWRGGGRLAPHETWDFTAGPVLRAIRSGDDGVRPYAEAGLGLHLLSNKRFSDALRSGTQYQFGLTVGVGVRFGEGGRYDLGWRVRHLSNAGIRMPNHGVNVSELRLQIAY